MTLTTHYQSLQLEPSFSKNQISLDSNPEPDCVIFFFRLMDVKQGLSKEGKTVLYLVFEYMDTDVKKYIRSFRQSGGNIPPQTIKVCCTTGAFFFCLLSHLSFISFVLA